MAKRRAEKEPKGRWIVLVRCEVIKELVCEGCTEGEARSDPFEHATDEVEVSQVDWEVKSVRPDDPAPAGGGA